MADSDGQGKAKFDFIKKYFDLVGYSYLYRSRILETLEDGNGMFSRNLGMEIPLNLA